MTKKFVSISKLTIALALVASFLLSPLLTPLYVSAQSGATVLNPSEVPHVITTTDGGKTLKDSAGHDLIFWYPASKDMVVQHGEGGRGIVAQKHSYSVYYIDQITKTDTFEYYVGFDGEAFHLTMMQYDRARNQLIILTKNDILVNMNNDKNQATLTDRYQYILGLADQTGIAITGISPETVGTTTQTLNVNCQATVTYNESSGIYKKLDPKPTSAGTGSTDYYAPKGARVGVLYQPTNSPVPFEVKQDSKIGDNGQISLNVPNLKPGAYTIYSEWALHDIDKDNTNATYKFDHLGSTGLLDWFYRRELPKLPTSGWGFVQNYLTGGNPLAQLYASYSQTHTVTDEAYGFYSSFTVSSEGKILDASGADISGSQTNLCAGMKATYLPALSSTSKGTISDCGAINSDYIMQWSFCQLLLAMRWLANWAYNRAENIFSSMTNISGVAIDTSGTKKLPEETGSGGNSSTQNPAQTPAATPNVTPSPNSGATPTTVNGSDRTKPSAQRLQECTTKDIPDLINGEAARNECCRQFATDGDPASWDKWEAGGKIKGNLGGTCIALDSLDRKYITYGPTSNFKNLAQSCSSDGATRLIVFLNNCQGFLTDSVIPLPNP